MALVVGFAGLLIRHYELANVFDPLTGLPERGALITFVLMGLTASFLMFAFIFSIVVYKKQTTPEGFENIFGTNSLIFPIFFILSGLFWLWSSIMHIVDLRISGHVPMAQIYFSVLSAIAAISVIFFTIEIYKHSQRKAVYALSVVPVLFMCFWLIFVYRENAANPVLLSHAYQVLAIIASTLSFYFSSGFVYGKPKHGRAVFFYLAAIFFCFITLADAHALMVRIVFCVIMAINVLYLSRLLRHLERKQPQD